MVITPSIALSSGHESLNIYNPHIQEPENHISSKCSRNSEANASDILENNIQCVLDSSGIIMSTASLNLQQHREMTIQTPKLISQLFPLDKCFDIE